MSHKALQRYSIDEACAWYFDFEDEADHDYPINPYASRDIADTAFDIQPADLDRRVRSIRALFATPKSRKSYVANMAERLRIKCYSAGRPDLVSELDDILEENGYVF